MHADRNLLLGILALQMDFVSRDQLVAALHAWVLAKHRPLGDLFAEHGALDAGIRALLDALVAKHLERHGGDPQRSLAALSSVPPTLKQELAALPDAEVRQTLVHLSAAGATDTGAAPPTLPGAAVPTAGGPAVRYRILKPHAKGGL